MTAFVFVITYKTAHDRIEVQVFSTRAKATMFKAAILRPETASIRARPIA